MHWPGGGACSTMASLQTQAAPTRTVAGEIKRTLIPRYALELYCARRLAFRNTLKQQLVVIEPATREPSRAGVA